MSDETAARMLAEIVEANEAIKAAVEVRDEKIRAAGAARISHREIMDAADLGRTRVHQIINEP